MVDVLAVVTNMGLDAHDTGRGHPERHERSQAAIAGLALADLTDALVDVAPRPALMGALARVHAPAYLAALEEACNQGQGHLDADTPFGPGSWETALLAAGSGLVAAEALAAGEADAAFVICRPPGHHARQQGGMGFCLINSIAVLAASLADAGERVLVLDWDVHHGNGTQEIFWDDPRVLFVSTHQAGIYPGTGAVHEVGGGSAIGMTMNLPLPGRASGDALSAGLDELVAPVVDAFAPTWVLVSAGFDGHRDDPLAGLGLSAGDFADVGRRARAFAPGPGRLVMFLEGGYDLDALAMSVGAAAASAVGARYVPEAPTAGGPGRDRIPALGAAWHAAVERLRG